MPADSRPPEDLFAAWAEAHEHGAAQPFEELLARHPDHAEELRRMHSDWELFAPILERVVPGSISGEEGESAPGAASRDDADALPPSPELIERLGIQLPESGRYRFRGVLGRGGGGVVLRVWDAKLRRPLAMKVVLGRGEIRPSGNTPPVDAAVLTRFVDEARIASQLDHPGIVPVHELGTDASGRAFFTMRLVRGEDLHRIFERARRGEPEWTQARLLGILARVCEAVAYAHGKGVLHRDLKPANVMVGRHGEVHVMDWGLARSGIVPAAAVPPSASTPQRSGVETVRAAERATSPESPLLTGLGAAVGTPAYMAPEQARAEHARVDARTDVYAIGAMLYELLAGEPPFVPRGADVPAGLVLMRVLEGPPAPLASKAPRAPQELVAICERAMAREPEQRYPDVQALERDLRAFLEGRVVAAYESGTWAETRKWVRRNRALAGALCGLGLALVIGIAVASSLTREARIQRSLARRDQYVAAVLGAQVAYRAGESTSAKRLLESAPPDNRGWEHHYLLYNLDRSSLQLPGSARLLACAPDGNQLLIGSPRIDGVTKSARLIDLASGNQLVEFGVLAQEWNYYISASFDAAGTFILTSDTDSVKVWDGSNGQFVQALGLDHSRSSFSSDGIYALTISGPEATAWDVRSGNVIRRFASADERDILQAALASNGASIALSCEGDGVTIIDVASNAVVSHMGDLSTDIRYLVFSPDGTCLLAVGAGSAWLWDLSSGKASLWGDEDERLRSGLFSPNGELLLLLGPEIARLVNVNSKTTIERWEKRLGFDAVTLTQGRSASFNPGGDLILTGYRDGTADIRDASTGKVLGELRGHESAVVAVCWSSDGQKCVTGTSDVVRVWDASTVCENATGSVTLRARRCRMMALSWPLSTRTTR